MCVRFLLLSALLSAFFTLGACSDPCVVLAERICDCEQTPAQRRQCVADRVDVLQRQVTPTEEELAFCSEKLDTCTCTALDINQTDACGFTVEAE